MENTYPKSFPVMDTEISAALGISHGSGSPERRLLAAMLERAILDFVGNDSKEIEEAEEWLFGSFEQPYAPFTFPWLCQELDLDIKQVKQDIHRMPKRGTQRVAPWYFSKEIRASSGGRAAR